MAQATVTFIVPVALEVRRDIIDVVFRSVGRVVYGVTGGPLTGFVKGSRRS
jgi:hypothetical protein